MDILLLHMDPFYFFTFSFANNFSFSNLFIESKLHIVKLPGIKDGASNNELRLFTKHELNPSRLSIVLLSLETITNGPTFDLYGLPLDFPLPGRTVLSNLCKSFSNPIFLNKFSKSFVLFMFSKPSIIIGREFEYENPFFNNNSLLIEADIAERIAFFLSFLF